jgi:hypothetical protein
MDGRGKEKTVIDTIKWERHKLPILLVLQMEKWYQRTGAYLSQTPDSTVVPALE